MSKKQIHIRPVKKHIVSGPDDSEIPADTESTHVMTVSTKKYIDIHAHTNIVLSQGVDKVHAEGITGSGVKIGM